MTGALLRPRAESSKRGIAESFGGAGEASSAPREPPGAPFAPIAFISSGPKLFRSRDKCRLGDAAHFLRGRVEAAAIARRKGLRCLLLPSVEEEHRGARRRASGRDSRNTFVPRLPRRPWLPGLSIVCSAAKLLPRRCWQGFFMCVCLSARSFFCLPFSFIYLRRSLPSALMLAAASELLRIKTEETLVFFFSRY